MNGKDCKVCHGFSKTKCILCGNKAKLKKNMTDAELAEYEAWEEEIKYLRETFHKLIKFRQKTSGCETLDYKVKKHIGDFVKLIALNDKRDSQIRKISQMKFWYNGETVFLRQKKYENNSRLCLQVVSAEEELIGVLTCNVIGENLQEGEFFVKDYSENRSLALAAMASGHFVDTGKRYNSGFVEIPIWRFKE